MLLSADKPIIFCFDRKCVGGSKKYDHFFNSADIKLLRIFKNDHFRYYRKYVGIKKTYRGQRDQQCKLSLFKDSLPVFRALPVPKHIQNLIRLDKIRKVNLNLENDLTEIGK